MNKAALEKNLNVSQKRAIEHAINRSIIFIRGPWAQEIRPLLKN